MERAPTPAEEIAELRREAASLAIVTGWLHPDDKRPYRAIVHDLDRRADRVEELVEAAHAAA